MRRTREESDDDVVEIIDAPNTVPAVATMPAAATVADVIDDADDRTTTASPNGAKTSSTPAVAAALPPQPPAPPAAAAAVASSPAPSSTASPASPAAAAAAATGARQTIEEKAGGEKIVRNSPYGSTRSSLGWGTPFAAPTKAFATADAIAAAPALARAYIGLSSLNAVPSATKSQREMAQLLGTYRRKFAIMEHCNPYHNMGEPATWQNWKTYALANTSVKGGGAQQPFLYTIKANQYLTHMKMLAMDDDTKMHLRNFFVDRCRDVMLRAGCLGAVLLQLPPNFRMTPDHLARLSAVHAALAEVGAGEVPIAVEFRHSSWFVDATYERLRALKWALVATHNYDVGDSPVVDTGAGFMYVRLHGAVGQYVGDYGADVMARWAVRVRDYLAQNPSNRAFVFLNNNESHLGGLSSSVADATTLGQSLIQGMRVSP